MGVKGVWYRMYIWISLLLSRAMQGLGSAIVAVWLDIKLRSYEKVSMDWYCMVAGLAIYSGLYMIFFIRGVHEQISNGVSTCTWLHTYGTTPFPTNCIYKYLSSMIYISFAVLLSILNMAL